MGKSQVKKDRKRAAREALQARRDVPEQENVQPSRSERVESSPWFACGEPATFKTSDGRRADVTPANYHLTEEGRSNAGRYCLKRAIRGGNEITGTVSGMSAGCGECGQGFKVHIEG